MAPKAESMGTSAAATRSLDALIVGAGFGGLYQLYYLRKLGMNCKVVDYASELGGIWYWNCYPGARVDSNIPVYEYSIEELSKDWTWSERFPSGAELRRYFQYVDNKLDLSRDVELNKGVQGVEFDTKSCRWNVKFSTGEVVDCKYFVLCIGLAAKIHIPDWKGMDTYKGIMHHTAKYPQSGIDFKGKRVAVIGTGASGVQTTQEVGPEVEHLTVLQRTPNLCLPMGQQKLDSQTEACIKHEGGYERIFKYRRETFGGFHIDFSEKKGDDDSAEQKKEFYEKLWSNGGFNFWLASYKDLLFDKKAEKTRARINDPVKKELLAPLLENQHHTFGTKRPALEQRYYEVCNQDNVDIITLKDNPIETFTETGIKMKNGDELQFDIIILATGFDSVTGGLCQIDIKGTDGVSLAEKWSKGTRTYLGMTTANFPNMYFLYGPQGPTGFANGPTMIELQGDWIVDAIDYCNKNNKNTMEATAESEAGWAKYVAELCNMILIPKTDSWYMGSNIPGKTHESLNYAGGVPRYVRECKEVVEKGYAGFVFGAPHHTRT